ncbi:hypothetical protein NC652_005458 [Populus alba x Populus x berolinensis]|uniref:Uncharacterized protein n=1 Tax=Populus alba x Populus x berolinensis TaxID=444605 RepID=A0AAD6RC84_9ROSI|nr:hypothetical protein NC652_005458 [Populus alba x Populus x berolinensis]KAJ7006092.1 hypothetical protein NC653_005441 [Populus alba x Populus x berolinensis]
MPPLSPRKGKFKFGSQTSTRTSTLYPAISGCLCTVNKFTSKETTHATAPIYLHQRAGNSSALSYTMRARIWAQVPDQ